MLKKILLLFFVLFVFLMFCSCERYGTEVEDMMIIEGIAIDKEKELFEEIFGSTFDFKKSPPYRLSCGYATKDLNGDGMVDDTDFDIAVNAPLQ